MYESVFIKVHSDDERVPPTKECKAEESDRGRKAVIKSRKNIYYEEMWSTFLSGSNSRRAFVVFCVCSGTVTFPLKKI